MATLMGFDYGTQKIGVAIGQTITGTASALETLRAVKNKPDWQRIDQLIEEWKPDALIVGYPLNVDNTHTDATSAALRFSRQLQGRYQLPVKLADERFTSAEARIRLGPRQKQIEVYDAMAAKLILETWLQEHPA
jgi:putative Holliday junction resolvase